MTCEPSSTYYLETRIDRLILKEESGGLCLLYFLFNLRAS